MAVSGLPVGRLLTARKPQYSTLIKHARGALATLRLFLRRKRRRDWVRSASKPDANVAVARDRPMMVRYWRCQP
jgi:hypothetical protein